MKKLIINAGSSSLRVSVFEEEQELAAFVISRIWEEKPEESFEYKGKKEKEIISISNHSEAFERVAESLVSKWLIENQEEIIGIAHRVVHGGQYFSEAVEINEGVVTKIEASSELARLHNPINLECIHAAQKVFTEIPHVAIFDTAFHQTIPEVNHSYALPLKYSKKYNIRKYGFHGASHKYMSERVVEISKRNLRRVITCHVWGGASMTAVRDGKSINTSMGLTPLDGLVMGTRTGDIDPGAILYLQEKENLSAEEMRHILNTQSGMLGLTEVTWDLRDIQAGIEEWNQKYQKALDIYISRIVRFIGWYIADLGWIDAIVFTGGVLQNSPMIRKSIADKLQCFGLDFDESQNDFRSQEQKISTENSKVELYVIPMEEEKMMNRELEKFL